MVRTVVHVLKHAKAPSRLTCLDHANSHFACHVGNHSLGKSQHHKTPLRKMTKSSFALP